MRGSGIYTTPVSVSVANKELVPVGKQFYKMEFMPSTDCTVVINDTMTIPVVGKVGISTDERDLVIGSFKIKEEGISYLFGGKY